MHRFLRKGCMEDRDINQLIYSKNVVEFVTVASEFCLTIEKVNIKDVKESLLKLQKLLPLLYLKTTMLPTTTQVLDDELEKYVSELDYNMLHQKWLEALNEHDGYYEVFDPNIQFGNETVTSSISESLLDIYQDVKDFLLSYQIGNEEVMNDALFDCLYHFQESWGQMLVNVLRAIHMLVYGDVEFDIEEKEDNDVQPGKGSPEWLDKFWGTDEEEM